jgi:biotin synthase-related radical SAM superfamily protein
VSFNVLFMAHAPDVDKEKHRSEIGTGKFHLLSVVVRDQEEALEVAREVVAEEDIDSILLCPGFTHTDVAELFDALGGRVGIFVARGDGPSNRIALQAMKEAYATD